MSAVVNLSGSLAFNGRAEISDLLIRRDWQALLEVLEHFRPMLRRMANDLNLPLLNRRCDASDIVQETLHDAVRGLQHLRARNSSQFVAWLLSLLHRRVMLTRRRHLHTAKRDIRRESPLSSPYNQNTPCLDPGSLPEEVVMELESVDRLLGAINKLPDELRLLLQWRYEEGLKYQQIGERLGRSADAVRMLTQRCLKRLRKELQRS